MSVFAEQTSSDDDSDVVSTSSDTSEDVLASVWRQYSIKYSPVYTLKVKKQFNSTRLAGKSLPALTCSLSYTVGHNSNYTTAVVKPTNSSSRWIRKVKVFPDKQEVRVYGKRWDIKDWARLQLQGDWNWGSGFSYPTLQYSLTTKWENDAHNMSSKFKVPRAPSLLQLRPHWNIKKHFPSVTGQVGGNSAEQHSVEQPYLHARVPRMDLVLTAGKPSNWKSVWPPNKLFASADRGKHRKLAWEESLDRDSRRDQFFRGLSAADKEAYATSHAHLT